MVNISLLEWAFSSSVCAFCQVVLVCVSSGFKMASSWAYKLCIKFSSDCQILMWFLSLIHI